MELFFGQLNNYICFECHWQKTTTTTATNLCVCVMDTINVEQFSKNTSITNNKERIERCTFCRCRHCSRRRLLLLILRYCCCWCCWCCCSVACSFCYWKYVFNSNKLPKHAAREEWRIIKSPNHTSKTGSFFRLYLSLSLSHTVCFSMLCAMYFVLCAVCIFVNSDICLTLRPSDTVTSICSSKTKLSHRRLFHRVFVLTDFVICLKWVLPKLSLLRLFN